MKRFKRVVASLISDWPPIGLGTIPTALAKVALVVPAIVLLVVVIISIPILAIGVAVVLAACILAGVAVIVFGRAADRPNTAVVLG